MPAEPRQIKSRRDAIDIVSAEAEYQGYSLMNIAILAGYSENYLTRARVTGSMSIQAAVDFLDTLGFKLTVAPKREDGADD